MLKKVIAAAAMAVTVAACAGCGGSSDPVSQIRASQEGMVNALKDNNTLKFCSYMTEPGKCIAGTTMAKAFLGDGELSDLIPSDVNVHDAMQETKIQVSQDGTQATVDGEKWIKLDGEWKAVYE
jgi:hypothetical protein